MSVPAESLGTPILDADESRFVALADPESLAAEQFRQLLARLDRAAAARPLRTVAISSCGRREGRSTTAANLALTAVREGRDAVLVECDLRRPSLASLLGLAPRPGLAEVVEGKADLPQALARARGIAALCAGETPREVVRMAVDALGDRVVGIVLNGVEENGYARYLRNDAIPA